VEVALPCCCPALRGSLARGRRGSGFRSLWLVSGVSCLSGFDGDGGVDAKTPRLRDRDPGKWTSGRTECHPACVCGPKQRNHLTKLTRPRSCASGSRRTGGVTSFDPTPRTPCFCPCLLRVCVFSFHQVGKLAHPFVPAAWLFRSSSGSSFSRHHSGDFAVPLTVANMTARFFLLYSRVCGSLRLFRLGHPRLFDMN
jgi:hypothetical protein